MVVFQFSWLKAIWFSRSFISLVCVKHNFKILQLKCCPVKLNAFFGIGCDEVNAFLKTEAGYLIETELDGEPNNLTKLEY